MVKGIRIFLGLCVDYLKFVSDCHNHEATCPAEQDNINIIIGEISCWTFKVIVEVDPSIHTGLHQTISTAPPKVWYIRCRGQYSPVPGFLQHIMTEYFRQPYKETASSKRKHQQWSTSAWILWCEVPTEHCPCSPLMSEELQGSRGPGSKMLIILPLQSSWSWRSQNMEMLMPCPHVSILTASCQLQLVTLM